MQKNNYLRCFFFNFYKIIRQYFSEPGNSIFAKVSSDTFWAFCAKYDRNLFKRCNLKCQNKKKFYKNFKSHLQMYPADTIGSSGSRFLKMYILVFSIIAKRSWLSLAHFMSQTSLRSNLTRSPSLPRVPSRSKNCSSPVTSMMDKSLK